MYAVVCDRCGKIPKLAYDGDNDKETHYIELNTYNYNFRGDRMIAKREVHLCEDCANELYYNFLELRKE